MILLIYFYSYINTGFYFEKINDLSFFAARLENCRSNMYVLLLHISINHYVQHTSGHYGSIDGRNAERCEFRGRTGNVHEH